MNLIRVFYNLARAYEIALLGGYSIKIVYDKSYLNAKDDYKLIKEFFKDIEFKSDGDLIVEIFKPSSEYLVGEKSKGETIDAILKRVETSRKRDEATFIDEKNSYDNLLKACVSKLNLSLRDIAMLQHIAAIIAKLDSGKGIIRIQHLTEAISYKSYFNDKIDAESGDMEFGKGIRISQSEHEVLDIQNAIDHLKSLL